jgi:hypothetical protein
MPDQQPKPRRGSWPMRDLLKALFSPRDEGYSEARFFLTKSGRSLETQANGGEASPLRTGIIVNREQRKNKEKMVKMMLN